MGRLQFVKNLDRTSAGADQRLYLDKETGDYYVLSGVVAMYTGWEILAFPADEKGEVTDWGEITGGRGIDFETAEAFLEDELEGDREVQ